MRGEVMRLPLLLLLSLFCPAQELDTASPRKATSVLDDLRNPDERAAYQRLYKETRPLERRSLATEFLKRFPDSWLLPQVLEAASKSAIEMGDDTAAIYYGEFSLRLYPENPLLLVPLALTQWRRGNRRAAADKAAAALDYLDRFAAPTGIEKRKWNTLREELRTAAAAMAAPGPLRTAPTRPDPPSSFASSEECRRCHPAEYSAWQQTGMARMLRPIRPENVIGDFSAPGASRLGDQFFLEIRRAPGAADRYRIDFTIGSKWQQAYATKSPSGDLHVLPLQYNRLEKSWVNYWRTIDPEGSERADPANFHRFSQATSYQENCAPCHTSQLRVKGFAEPGVNCEMCHGPSAAHAKDAATAPAFRFSRLNNRQYVEICAQCHAQSAIREQQGFPPKYRRRPYTEYSRRAFYRDGRFRETTFIVESFERSACFRKGNAHCGHCHDPHPADAAANPKSLKFQNDPDRMCLQCHPASFSSQKHTRHAASAEASRCVSCHMPKIMNSLLFLARSHQIDDKPDASLTERFGSRESPNACLMCHPDRSALWTKEHLRSW